MPLEIYRPRTVDALRGPDAALENVVDTVLNHYYPDNMFRVIADHRGGILKINMPPLMSAPNWYVIKLRDLFSDPGMKLVRNAAGEILERYRIKAPSGGEFWDKVAKTPYVEMRHAKVPE